MKNRIVLAASAAVCLWSGTLSAEDLSSSAVQGYASTADAKLRLNLHGHIKPKCAIRLDQAYINTKIYARAGKERIGVHVDCNDVMQVEFRSRNGGLKHTAASSLKDSPGFTSLIDYDARLDIHRAGALPVSIPAEQALTWAGGSIGTVPYTSDGVLSLNWHAEKEPFGGQYSDVLEIRVSIRGETNGRGQ